MLTRFGILCALIIVTTQASYLQLEKNSQSRLYQGLSDAFQSQLLANEPSDLQPEDYDQILSAIPFGGPWISTNTGSQVFGYLDKTEGYMSVIPLDSDTSDFNMLSLELTLYDGKYVDQKYVKITIQTPINSLIFNQGNASLTGQQSPMNVTAGYDNTERELKNCSGNFTLYFLDIEAGGPFVTSTGKTLNDIGLQIAIQSPSCSIGLLTGVLKNNDVDQNEVMIYIGLQVASAIIGIVSAKVLLRDFPGNLNKLSRVCLWSIWIINAWDFYTFLFHVALSVAFSGWIIIIGIVYFALSIMFETKLVYGIYIGTNSARAFTNFASGCKFFALYYGLLYLLVFSYTFFTRSVWAILSSSLYIIPQNVLVFTRGRKYKFNLWHLIGLGMTRMVFVGYVKIYPNNIFRLSPDLVFVMVYFGIILAQISVLSVQKVFPKFCFTPKPFKYFVKVTDSQEKEETCPICMEIFQEGAMSSKTPLLDAKKSVVVMQTPCKHRFHTECLMAWMKTKLECPSCRQPVPSLNNEEV